MGEAYSILEGFAVFMLRMEDMVYRKFTGELVFLTPAVRYAIKSFTL
jgi:hypothetical protein